MNKTMKDALDKATLGGTLIVPRSEIEEMLRGAYREGRSDGALYARTAAHHTPTITTFCGLTEAQLTNLLNAVSDWATERGMPHRGMLPRVRTLIEAAIACGLHPAAKKPVTPCDCGR